MINQEIARIFQEMAEFLLMEEAAFKPQAYEKAALSLETLRENIGEIYKKEGIEGLKNIPGVGQGIAEKIIEYLKTGKIKEHQRLKKKFPIKIEELMAVEGIGPKMARDLYEQLKIKDIKDLEKAAQAGKIRGLPRFGLKTEQNILQGIKFFKKSGSRFLLGEILPRVYEIIAELKNLKEVKQISEAGSVRRRQETIGDVDILIASSDPEKVIDHFVSLSGVIKIWNKGRTKASIRLSGEYDVDLRVLPEKQFGSALQYFTGSKEHNIVLRKIAVKKGLKLSEYGLFRGEKRIAVESEEEIYEKLGLEWISPEIRENTGEIESALKTKLPELIELKDIKGDCHCHSHWGAGKRIISELAETAIKIGYEYIGISDHTKFLRIEHGLDEKQLIQQKKEIEKINSRLRQGFGGQAKFKILQGCEANIMADGSIDISDKVLAKLDYVIAGVHSQMKMTESEMTERIVKAMRNPNVDIISHPTGRILKQRDEYKIDFDRILRVAKETGTILEINANPYRLDLNDKNIRQAKKIGVKMIINSDAHQKEQLNFMPYGVFQARRGWAEKKDVINAWPLKEFLNFIKR